MTAIQQENERLARLINQEALRDRTSSYAGKFVGIANGKVIVVANTLDEVARELRQREPDLSKTFCIEVGVDYDQVQEVWVT